MGVGAIIFDFDGVIADSELLANRVLAETVTGLGLPTTVDDALDRYMGRRWPEVIAAIGEALGSPLPGGFGEALKAATLARFVTDLSEVQGATAFIRATAYLPRCIASSSSPDRLTLSLDRLGLVDDFAGRVFSAEAVARGKPHPDIFLHAAAQLGVSPSACLVIEDSLSGVRAGVAAGMTVIGLCAASHIRAGHAERLMAAGAAHIATGWDEVAALLGRLEGVSEAARAISSQQETPVPMNGRDNGL